MDLNVIQFNKIDALKQQINTELALRPFDVSSVTSKIAYVKGGFNLTNAKVLSGPPFAPGVGNQIIWPVPFFSNMDKRRSGYEEVAHSPPEMINFQLIVSEWAPDGEMIQRGTQVSDLYGIFANNFQNILNMGQATVETHMADLLGYGESATLSTKYGIGGGNTSYDNLPYFHGAHLINPNHPEMGNFPNYFPSTNLDRSGLTTMLQFLEATPNSDGQIVTLPGKNVIVVSTQDQYDRAAVYLHGTTRVGGTTTNVAGSPVGVGGSESNGALQGRADLVMLPSLLNYNKNASGVAKGWYGFRVSAPHCGVCIAIVEPPQLYIEGLSPNDTSRVTRNVIKYGRRGFWGHGYLWPQMGAKAIEQ